MDNLPELVKEIDSLVIATGLALASLTPGPAGQAGSVAAIAFDVKRKCWYGVALSATSMIPLAGYVPAFFKLGLLIYQLDNRLKVLENSEINLQDSPESMAVLVNGLGKYYRKLPDIWLTRRLRKHLQRIMGMETMQTVDQISPAAALPDALPKSTDPSAQDTSTSTQIP